VSDIEQKEAKEAAERQREKAAEQRREAFEANTEARKLLEGRPLDEGGSTQLPRGADKATQIPGQVERRGARGAEGTGAGEGQASGDIQPQHENREQKVAAAAKDAARRFSAARPDANSVDNDTPESRAPDIARRDGRRGEKNASRRDEREPQSKRETKDRAVRPRGPTAAESHAPGPNAERQSHPSRTADGIREPASTLPRDYSKLAAEFVKDSERVSAKPKETLDKVATVVEAVGLVGDALPEASATALLGPFAGFAGHFLGYAATLYTAAENVGKGGELRGIEWGVLVAESLTAHDNLSAMTKNEFREQVEQSSIISQSARKQGNDALGVAGHEDEFYKGMADGIERVRQVMQEVELEYRTLQMEPRSDDGLPGYGWRLSNWRQGRERMRGIGVDYTNPAKDVQLLQHRVLLLIHPKLDELEEARKRLAK